MVLLLLSALASFAGPAGAATPSVTTTTVTSSLSPAVFGQSVTISAVVKATSGSPSGTVTFTEGATTLGSTTLWFGKYSITLASLAGGTHQITASYAGSATFAPSTATFTQIVDPAPTAVTVSSRTNPTVTGQGVTLVATVAPVSPTSATPTGTVTFTEGGTNLGSTTIYIGKFTLTIPALAVGSHQITATYSGNASFAASSATFTHTVGPAATAVTVSSAINPTVTGQGVSLVATVATVSPGAGQPSGTVRFSEGATTLGSTTLWFGKYSLALPAMALGTHQITATFLGNASYAASSATFTHTVALPGTTVAVSSSSAPSVFGQPVSVSASVAASGTGTGRPSGTVTFSEGSTTVGSGSLGNGQTSVVLPPLAVGDHVITASYGGDIAFGPSAVTFTQTVLRAATTTTGSSSLSPAPFGHAVALSAAVTVDAPGAGQPTGTVTFSEGPTDYGTSVLADGAAAVAVESLPVGVHAITATYSGDATFRPSTVVITLTVTPAPSTVSAASALDPAVFGQALSLSAAVAPAAPGAGQPTGSITVSEDGTDYATVELTDGATTAVLPRLDVGTHTLTIRYLGDGNFQPNTTTLTQTVTAAASSISVTSSSAPSTFGQAVSVTATVSATDPTVGTPSGSVTFAEGNTVIGFAAVGEGSATLTISSLAVGDHDITVTYTGDGWFGASATSLSQTVAPAASSVTVTPSVEPSELGEPTTLNAAVDPLAPGAGQPTGTVSFTEGDTPLGTFVLTDGVAALDVTALPIGEHTITATYSGDASFEPATIDVTHAVTPVAPKVDSVVTLDASTRTAMYGQTVSLTASVGPTDTEAGLATGSVTFDDGGSLHATVAILDGQATVALPTLAVGDHLIRATYSGDHRFGPSTSSISQTVTPAASTLSVTSSANPMAFGQVASLTTTVSGPGLGQPTGAVSYTEGGAVLATGVLVDGGTTATLPVLGVGDHTITASFGGDGNFDPASTTAMVSVTRAQSIVSVSAQTNPSALGQPTSLTATVSATAPGLPTGTVTFTEGDANYGTANLTAGQASIELRSLGVGDHTITATYSGDDSFAASSSASTQTVTPGASEVAVPAPTNPSVVGQPTTIAVTVTAAVAGAGQPTGTVQIAEGATVYAASTLTDGIAALELPAFPVGDHTLVVTYDGDSSFTASTTAFVQTVNRAGSTVAVEAATNPTVVGQGTALTAAVSAAAPGAGQPTGTVTFTEGAVVYGTATVVGGAATAALPPLPVGDHTIAATYSGDLSFTAVASTFTQTVAAAPTSVTVTASANPITFGQAVTLTAVVAAVAPGAGSPTGSVTLSEDGTTLGTGALANGRASVTVGALAGGSHTIVVTYGGNSSYLTSSTPFAETVSPAASVTTLTTSVSTAVAGQPIILNAVVTPANAKNVLNGTVTFTDGTTVLGTVGPWFSKYSLTVTNLAAGTHQITATFNGTTSYRTSTATTTQTVVPADTTVTFTTNPTTSTAGQPVTLTATVNPVAPSVGAPGGTVTFTDGTTVLGTTGPWFSKYSLTVTNLAAGTHQITATFNGTTSYRTSTATTTQTVVPILWVAPPPPGDPNYHDQVIPPYSGTGPTVALLGDSITFLNDTRSQAALQAAGFSTSVTGNYGYTAANDKPWADLYADTHPDVVIINLGTNDANQQAAAKPNFTTDVFKQRMAAYQAEFAGSCFVVTTITSHRTAASFPAGTADAQIQAWNAIATEYNAYLRTFAHVVDWDAAVASHPEYLVDEIHPFTAPGSQVLAALDVAAAQTCGL